jgi:hypothetical protein
VTQSSNFETPMESYWHHMISEAAYYLAEKRGFLPGRAMEDWLEAELQVKDLLSGQADAPRTQQARGPA